MRPTVPVAGNWSSRRLAILIALLGLNGCGEDERVEQEKLIETVEAARAGAIVLQTTSPDTLLSVKGPVRDDGKEGIVWTTPAAARISVEVPYDEAVDLASLRVKLFANGAKGQPVDLGSSKIEAAIHEKGKLILVVEHGVLANFETGADMSLRIAVLNAGELHEIANVPFRGSFE